MRFLLLFCLILMLTSLSAAQESGICDTNLIRAQMNALHEAASTGGDTDDAREILDASRQACTDAVDLSSLTLTAGSPEEICEQATPAINPAVTEWDEAEQVIVEGVDYQAIFCTDVGAIYLELFEDEAPITVNNMVFLARNNYYNNTIFHRVIEDFMAQGGDPTGTGRGGPGYQFEDEIVDDLVFDRPYLLAMANAGPDTNGSQFFITFVETPHLDGGYTIFGEVISGQDAVDDIMFRDPNDEDAPATMLYAVVIVTPDLVEQQ